MEETKERTGLGLVPKLIICGLAVFGLFSLVGWLMSFIFGAVKVGLLLVAVVVIGLFVLSRFNPPGTAKD